jgi:hypothetical protein
MSSYDTLGKAAAHQRVKLRRRQEAVLRHLGTAMTLQEQLAWDLLDKLCVLDPTSLLLGRIRIGKEQWWCYRTGQAIEVSFVRLPVPRNWSRLWVIHTPEDVLLSKYNPLNSFWWCPFEEPRLFDILEKVLTHLGLPARFDA